MVNQDSADFKNQEMLSAYLDGELGVADRAVVEGLIRDNPQLAKLIESWRSTGISMRALPKSRLDTGFVDRVLSRVERVDQKVDPPIIDNQSIVDDQSIDGVVDLSSSDVFGVAPTGQSSDRVAMIAIGALCASLLLTMFAFPSLSKSPNTQSPVAQSPPAEVAASIELTTESQSEVAHSSAPVSSVPVSSEQPDDDASHIPLQRMRRGMKLPKNMRPVPSGEVSAIGIFGANQNVEQIVHVRLGNQGDQFDIEAFLSRQSIKTDGIEASDWDSSDVEAIYAVASLDKIQKAAAQLVEKFSAEVTFIPVPASTKPGLATRLKTKSFVNDSNGPEIAELNQWFGLTAADESYRSTQFLILLSR